MYACTFSLRPRDSIGPYQRPFWIQETLTLWHLAYIRLASTNTANQTLHTRTVHYRVPTFSLRQMHELGLTQLPMLSTDNVGKNFSREVERIFFSSPLLSLRDGRDLGGSHRS